MADNERIHHDRRESDERHRMPGTGRSFLSGYQAGEFQVVRIERLLRLRLASQVRPAASFSRKRLNFISLFATSCVNDLMLLDDRSLNRSCLPSLMFTLLCLLVGCRYVARSIVYG